ncbi:hypothetical protein BOX15_Mlig000043g1 [Macrostomum lignano]|uniref:Cadherin domain-containing protein n=1 Tax=Macrostomum lignano TaxID=282301 RepID=A0A267EAP1_9PLAT|nr:hypothetical protein BOX15_Mlig000043g1 [Macrostomum lignano]
MSASAVLHPWHSPIAALLKLLPPLLAVVLLMMGLPRTAEAACNSSLNISEISETTPAGYGIYSIDSSYQNTLLGLPEYICYFELSGGFLRLARTFDLENFTSCSDGSTISKASVPSAITVTIQCTSSSDTATFLIRLVDVNEFPPAFSPNYFAVNVSESASVNTLITQLNSHVTDADKSNQLTFNFQLTNGTLGSFYIIDGITSGIVRLQRTLDFDAGPRQYIMTVAASELPTEPASQPAALTGFATLVVNVLDYDDQNPEFTQNSYSLYFMENNTAYMNSPLTASPPLLALDQDVGINETINYAIVSAYWWNSAGSQIDNTSFIAINSTTGQFSIVSLIDRESLPASQLFVLVKGYQTDKPATRVALALVLVTVGDRNDNAPVMSATDYSATIVENSPAGTFVIGVSATDRDLGENSTVSYLLADPSGAFQIDPNSGHVTVANASLLDREATPEFNVTVWSEETATPERFASTPSRLTIRLTDVNDNSPVFANASGISISLDRSVATPGAALHTLVATDADSGINGQLTFSIVFVSVPGAESLFNLDSGSGLLTAAAGLSSAPGDLFVLNVVAEDRAEPSSARRRSTVSLSVRLTSSTSSSASTVATTSSDAVTSSSSQAPTSTTSSSTTSTTTTTTTTSTTSTMATSAAPAESWNASVAASAVWMINDSHATVELRTTQISSSGNQTVTMETVVLPVNSSLIAQAPTTEAPSTSTSGSTSLTTPESVTSLESLNATTYEAATTSETTAAPTEQLVQPAPLGLIVACALLAVIASVLGLLLGWFLFERSRLKALAAERLATIESLQQKTNPIFSNGQHPPPPEVGPESALSGSHSQPDGSAAIYVSQQLAPDPAYQTLSVSMPVSDF